ncbi:MAG: hypothetical protein ACRDZ3_04725 [Acidimicrobiia bacterium]
MKVFKPTTMAIFGLGFLAGSRSGRAAWDAVENKVSQMQNRNVGGLYGNGAKAMPDADDRTSMDRTLSEF